MFISKIGQATVIIRSIAGQDVEVRGAWTGRDKLWAIAWEGIKNKPYLGHGFGTNQEALSYYSFGRESKRVHNAYLKIWLELGFIGLLITNFMFYNYLKVLKKQHVFSTFYNDTLLSSLLLSRYVDFFIMLILAFFGWSAYLDKNLWLNFSYILSLNKIYNYK